MILAENRVDIKSMLLDEIENDFLKYGYPKYRAKQVFKWLGNGVETFDDMTNLAKNVRAELANKYFIPSVSIEKKSISKIDGTIKYLFRLDDGDFIESVLMKYKHGFSICLSTQVGCTTHSTSNLSR